jgi:hypothetical protein
VWGVIAEIGGIEKRLFEVVVVKPVGVRVPRGRQSFPAGRITFPRVIETAFAGAASEKCCRIPLEHAER